jgi:hypothetical protein
LLLSLVSIPKRKIFQTHLKYQLPNHILHTSVQNMQLNLTLISCHLTVTAEYMVFCDFLELARNMLYQIC